MAEGGTAIHYASDLATKMVRESFGELPERVVSLLLAKGLCTFGELQRGWDSGVPHPSAANVKQALLVLIQHNCVAAYTQKEEEGVRQARPPQVMYEASVERILQLLRRHKFLLHIQDESGEMAEDIVQQLQQNGRLRLDQLIPAVATKQNRPISEVGDTIRNTFISLVQAHYIERAPPCDLPPPSIRLHPGAVKQKGRGAKAGSADYAQDQGRQLKFLEEVRYQEARFKLPSGLLLDAIMSGEEAVAGGDGAAGSKRKREDGAAEDEAGVEEKDEEFILEKLSRNPVVKKARMKAGTSKATAVAEAAAAAAPPALKGKAGKAVQQSLVERAKGVEPAQVLWRINPEEFNRRFRHKAIVALMEEKVDQDAGTVIAAMLEASRGFERDLRAERSTGLCEDEISAAVSRLVTAGLREELLTDVRSVIRSIEALDNVEFISYLREGPGGSLYAVNMIRFIDLLRQKQVESISRNRFGNSGCRVLRMLVQNGHLEQKQVGDICMLPHKETREVLYLMLKHGFVVLQDIPRTSERTAARTIYTWSFSLQSTVARVAGDLYRCAGNTWSRLQLEHAKEQQLIDLIDSVKETGRMDFTLTAAQKTAIARLKSVGDVMEASLSAIDEQIALFNDY
ncbi:MAG: hypothetical protein WDW36_004273 [Sanguina aurantia]